MSSTRSSLVLAIFAVLGSVSACSGKTESASPPNEQPETGVDAGADTGTDARPPPVEFGPCEAGYVSECATIQMPLDHDHPEGETIDFHFSRYPAATQPAKRQVWLLAGGPGQAGYVYGKLVPDLAALLPDADLMVPDHRGTGYSHRLTCKAQDVKGSVGGLNLNPAQAPRCLDALRATGDYDRLPYFTSTQAAADVLDAIARTRGPEQKVFVWGASYGTHWAHRMMQIAPTALDGAIFDGFLTPAHWAFADYDRGAEEAGEAFAAKCDLDASCTKHLGPGGALVHVRKVLAGLEEKPCGPFRKEDARRVISSLLDPWTFRALVFPMIHRLERCNEADVTALLFMTDAYNTLLRSAYELPYVNSGILQHNITAWELWAKPGQTVAGKDALVAAADAQSFLQGAPVAGILSDIRTFWPAPRDDYSRYAVPVTTTTKQLWLSGELDLHAYPSQAALLPSVYPKATYIQFKDASHVPSRQSPLVSDPKKHCGQEIVIRFIEGDGAVDTSCLAGMAPATFELPTGELAKKYWDDADDWGDGTPKP